MEVYQVAKCVCGLLLSALTELVGGREEKALMATPFVLGECRRAAAAAVRGKKGDYNGTTLLLVGAHSVLSGLQIFYMLTTYDMTMRRNCNVA